MNKLCILLLILICILIVNNTKSFNKKVIKGGNMIKNINNKTTYFTIKINKNQEEEDIRNRNKLV